MKWKEKENSRVIQDALSLFEISIYNAYWGEWDTKKNSNTGLIIISILIYDLHPILATLRTDPKIHIQIELIQ